MSIHYFPVSEIQVTKLEVIEKQVIAAIKLYFRNEDPISVSTLVEVSHSLLVDMNRHLDGNPMPQEFSELSDSPDVQDAILRGNKRTLEFLTKPDDTPNKVFKFHPEEAELIIMQIINKLHEINGKYSPEMLAFRIWFSAWFEQRDLLFSEPMESIDFEFIRNSYSKTERERFYLEWKESVELVSRMKNLKEDYEAYKKEHLQAFKIGGFKKVLTSSEAKLSESDERMFKVIPIIKKVALELIDLTAKFNDLQFIEDDHYGFVLIAFYKRMLRHVKSLVLLEGNGDMFMIARSMIEGEMLLKWIAQGKNINDKNIRSKRYLDLFYADAAKHYEKFGGNNKAELDAILARVFANSDLISAKEYNVTTGEFSLDNKSLVKRLTGYNNTHEFFKALDEIEKYKRYGYMSGYLHWNPFLMKMYHDENEVGILELGINEVMNTWMLGYFAFSKCCENICLHFKTENIQQVLDHELASLKSINDIINPDTNVS